MGKGALLWFLVVVTGGCFWCRIAKAEEPVEPLPPATSAANPDSGEGDTRRAPQARDRESPRLRFNAPAPSSSAGRSSLAEPDTMQMVLGIVMGVGTSIVSIETYAGTHGNVWYTGAAALGGALGTGAIVCAVGQLSPTRRGGCRGSLVGALIGVVGAVPGLLLLYLIAKSPCSGAGEEQDGCLNGQVLGGIASISAAAAGFSLGTAYGAQTGWRLGAVSRGAAPTAATASLLSVHF